MDTSVKHMLELSERLGEQLASLFERPRQPDSQRALLTLAMCDVAMEQWTSQRILIHAGCHTSALALIRLQFEAAVRAIWLHEGASDEWLERFSAPMEPGQLSEPVLGPSVDAMLQTINKTAPAFVGLMLGELKTASWQPMNSYVHGGIRPIVQTLAGATPYQLVSVLRNANGLAMLVSNVFVLACRDSSLGGRIRQIQLANPECLPPVSST